MTATIEVKQTKSPSPQALSPLPLGFCR